MTQKPIIDTDTDYIIYGVIAICSVTYVCGHFEMVPNSWRYLQMVVDSFIELMAIGSTIQLIKIDLGRFARFLVKMSSNDEKSEK